MQLLAELCTQRKLLSNGVWTCSKFAARTIALVSYYTFTRRELLLQLKFHSADRKKVIIAMQQVSRNWKKYI